MDIEDASHLTCPICQKLHNHRSGKTKCIQKHQGIECPICKIKLTAKSSLVRHSRGTACAKQQIRTAKGKEENSHVNVGPSRAEMDENMARIAAIRDLYSRTCQVCNKVFKTSSGKTKCMRKHQGPIVCPICNNVFAQEWCLKRHMETACRAIIYDSASTTSEPPQVNINTTENAQGNANEEHVRNDNVNNENAPASATTEHVRSDNVNTENAPGSTTTEHVRNDNVNTEIAPGSPTNEHDGNTNVTIQNTSGSTRADQGRNDDQETVTNNIESSNGEPVNINIKVHKIQRARTVNINIILNSV